MVNKPSALFPKVPALVYERVPSGFKIWKNPLPSIAISRALSVVIIFPWVKSLSVFMIFTPVPTLKPEVFLVSPVVCAPEVFSTWYSSDSKFALSLLKPVVFTLARLF